MRCTQCSREVKPIVAIDIDGTLGDYHSHFINFADVYLGRQESTLVNPMLYNGKGSFREWCCKWWGIEEGTWKQIKLAYRQGGMKRSMPVYDGAGALCREVKAEGAELWLTTTRPFLRLDNIDPDTRFWLDRQGIDPDGLLYDEKKYELLGSYVDKERVVAVLDDQPDQWNEAARVFGWRIPILRRNTFNRGIPSDCYVDNLNWAIDVISERIDKWYKEHS